MSDERIELFKSTRIGWNDQRLWGLSEIRHVRNVGDLEEAWAAGYRALRPLATLDCDHVRDWSLQVLATSFGFGLIETGERDSGSHDEELYRGRSSHETAWIPWLLYAFRLPIGYDIRDGRGTGFKRILIESPSYVRLMDRLMEGLDSFTGLSIADMDVIDRRIFTEFEKADLVRRVREDACVTFSRVRRWPLPAVSITAVQHLRTMNEHSC